MFTVADATCIVALIKSNPCGFGLTAAQIPVFIALLDKILVKVNLYQPDTVLLGQLTVLFQGCPGCKWPVKVPWW